MGLVERRVLSTRPTAVACEITDFNRLSLGVLDQLRIWPEEYDI